MQVLLCRLRIFSKDVNVIETVGCASVPVSLGIDNGVAGLAVLALSVLPVSYLIVRILRQLA